MKTLNQRYDCYKKNLPADELKILGRAYCENSTTTSAGLDTCLKSNNMKNFPDNLVITLDSNSADPTSYPFWLIGFDPKDIVELKALGVPPDASECTNLL